jgi:hypothetical protein
MVGLSWKKLKRRAAFILRCEGTIVSDKHGERYEHIPESARAEIRQLLREREARVKRNKESLGQLN